MSHRGYSCILVAVQVRFVSHMQEMNTGPAGGCTESLIRSSAERSLTCLPGERTDVSLKYLPGLTEALQLHSVITSSAISGFVNFPWLTAADGSIAKTRTCATSISKWNWRSRAFRSVLQLRQPPPSMDSHERTDTQIKKPFRRPLRYISSN